MGNYMIRAIPPWTRLSLTIRNGFSQGFVRFSANRINGIRGFSPVFRDFRRILGDYQGVEGVTQ